MLDVQRAELERQGYSIVSESPHEVVATRGKWYWDSIATHVLFVVFLRRTGPLSAANIASETERMVARAKELDRFPLPVGFQHGRAIVPVYIADSVEPDAREQCVAMQPMRFGSFVFPAALDLAANQAFYLPKTPMWGGIYYGKLRWLAKRLVGEAGVADREPISVFGALLGLFIIGSVVWLVVVMVQLTTMLGSLS
jgi:hypothetical protein